MPRFPVFRRLSSISDYKLKKEAKCAVIDEISDQKIDQIDEDNGTTKSKITNDGIIGIQDLERNEAEEKVQFAVKQLREFILSHPKIINPIAGELIETFANPINYFLLQTHCS